MSRHARTMYPFLAPHRLGGFSLVELMVAMVISSLLLIGVVQIFIQSREAYKLDEGLSRVQESGRFAAEFLDREVRMAGNMGCLAKIKPQNITNYLAGGGAPFDLSRGIEGFEAVGTNPGQTYSMAASYPTVALSSSNANWGPVLNAGLLPATVAVPGSDIIVVRYLSSESASLAPPFNSSAQMFVRTPNSLAAGQVVIASDCDRISIFQINSVSSGGGVTTITHPVAGTPGNICAVWGSPQCPQDKTYTNGAEIGLLQASIFYVGRGADGSSSLFQQRFDNGVGVPNELVSGIENMQIVYGVDTDMDKPAGQPRYNADTYLPANLVTDWTRVVSARISLLARTYNAEGTAVDTTQDLSAYDVAGTTIDPVVNANDKQRRRVFNVTIKLRNR